METFSKRILELRKQAGYTQAYVASVLGIKQPSYIRYENSGAEPTLANLVRIADLYDVFIVRGIGNALVFFQNQRQLTRFTED